MDRAEHRKYHIIYKTTNLLNGKFYVGMHSTNDLNDGYMGSGKRIRYSIVKYGKENHKFEILEMLPNRELLKQREAEIINEKFLDDDKCLNLVLGGNGGFPEGAQAIGSKLGIEKRNELFSDSEWREYFRETHSEGQKKRFEKHGLPEGFGSNKLGMLGKKHTDEAKSKMAEFHKGENNSQFGTCWIHNVELQQNLKIKKEDLDSYLNEGWIKGRKIKKMEDAMTSLNAQTTENLS